MTTDQCRGCEHLEIDEGEGMEFTYCYYHYAWPFNVRNCHLAPTREKEEDA